MIEVFLNGVRTELQGVKVSLTSQVNNIAELKDRQATFTNKFKLKKTPSLIKLLKGLGIVGNTSIIPYIKVDAKLKYHGIEVLENGNAYITGSDIDNIFATIYDGNIFLFQEIGDKKLNELDWSDLDHQLNLTTYKDSFTNTEGYIYAVSNNGQFTPTTSAGIEVNYQTPSVFIHTVWDKLFGETSYTYSGDIFSTNKFKSLVMTMKRGYNADIDAVNNPILINQSFDNDLAYTITEEPQQGDDILFSWYVRWNLSRLVNEGILENGVIRFVEDSQYTIQWNLVVNSIPQTSDVRVRIRNINTGDAPLNSVTNNVSGAINLNGSVTFGAVAGDEFVFEVEVFGESLDINPVGAISNFVGTWNIADANTNLIDISIAQFIGDMSQKTFIKDIMQHFGLVIKIDQGSTVYQFKKMQNILVDVANAEDWSDKFIRVKKESYVLKGYAIKNKLAYNYFDTDKSPFADGFITVNNKNLKPTKTLFTRPYNACDVSPVALNDKIVTLTPFWEAQRDDTGAITGHRPISNKNYIAELQTNYESITYGFSSTLGTVYEGDIPRLYFRNLHYNSLVSANYSNLEKSLSRQDAKDCEFRLSAKDVKDIDYFKLVYVKQLGAYFLKNKVKYSGETTSIVELLKIAQIPIYPNALQLSQSAKSRQDAGEIGSGSSGGGCDLVANAGSYGDVDVTGGINDIVFSSLGSSGDITSWRWELITAPAGGTLTFSTATSDTTKAVFNAVLGTYTIKLTISNSSCSDESLVNVTTI